MLLVGVEMGLPLGTGLGAGREFHCGEVGGYRRDSGLPLPGQLPLVQMKAGAGRRKRKENWRVRS